MKGLTANVKSGTFITIGDAKVTVKETRGRWAILVIEAPPEIKITRPKPTGTEPQNKGEENAN